MNREDLLARCRYFHLVHGVTVRAIETLADHELDFRPRPGMRSPRELVFHIYCQEKMVAQAAQSARFTPDMANASNPEDPSNAAALGALRTVKDAAAYANECHRSAHAAFTGLSEEMLAKIVESPLGPYPAWQYFLFAYDEHWHHRGQLYSYLRLLGKEPPMLYDYQPAGA